VLSQHSAGQIPLVTTNQQLQCIKRVQKQWRTNNLYTFTTCILYSSRRCGH